MNRAKNDIEAEDVQELLQASLRELSVSHLDLPASKATIGARQIATSAAQFRQDIESQFQQISATFARVNANIQTSFKRLSPSKKTNLIKKLAAHGTTQQRIATLLGMTQSAVSQHLNKRNKNTAHRLESIARIDALLNAGASNTAILTMMHEQGVSIDATSFATFLKVYLQITDAEV